MQNSLKAFLDTPIYFIKLSDSNWLDYIMDIVILSNVSDIISRK